MTMSRARRRRVVRVFEELVDGGTTVSRLAHQLGVSSRSVHRDLAELRAAGVPIVGTIGVGIRCAHRTRVEYSRSYPKCSLDRAQWTKGPGSDIKVRWPACERWEAKR